MLSDPIAHLSLPALCCRADVWVSQGSVGCSAGASVPSIPSIGCLLWFRSLSESTQPGGPLLTTQGMKKSCFGCTFLTLFYFHPELSLCFPSMISICTLHLFSLLACTILLEVPPTQCCVCINGNFMTIFSLCRYI